MGSCFSLCRRLPFQRLDDTGPRFSTMDIIDVNNGVDPIIVRDDGDQFQNLDSSDSSLDIEIEKLNLFYQKYAKNADQNGPD